MSHLTPQRLQALLTSGEADPALLAHLEAGCDECDAVLAASPWLDGAVDAALLALVKRPAVSDAPPWRGEVPRPAAARRRTPVALLAAVAAAVLGVVLVPRLLSPTGVGPGDGLKGAEAPVLVALEAAVRRGDAGFEALSEGATVRAGDVLVLRADASRAAHGWVLLQRQDGSVEALEPVELRAGAHVLERDLGLLGVSLDGEAGEVSVWVVVGASPPSRELAVAGVESAQTSPLSRAGVRVRVLP